MNDTEVETTEKPSSKHRDWSQFLPTLTDSVMAVVLALIVGALVIVFSDDKTIGSLSYFFAYPWDFFTFAGQAVADAYGALVKGSIGSPGSLVKTMERGAPLICAGLGVAVAFRAGLFNIGAQGQMLVGAIVGGYIGFGLNLPPVIHLVAAMAGAVVAGALYGAIAGFLKGRTGAHEVIVTIMLNNVARFIVLYFLGKEAFQRVGTNNKISPPPLASAQFPEIGALHLGVAVAALSGVLVWWVLDRSTWGFQMRAVGANPDAARTAGMNVPNVYVMAMAFAGALSGLGVTMVILGNPASVTESVVGTLGFDAITVALLGRGTPLGTVFAGLLFGGLTAGGLEMQASAGIAPEMSQVLQALIVLFVAAPALVRGFFRIRSKSSSQFGANLNAGWGA